MNDDDPDAFSNLDRRILAAFGFDVGDVHACWGANKAVIAAKLKALRERAMGKLKIARTLKISTSTVQRILA